MSAINEVNKGGPDYPDREPAPASPAPCQACEDAAKICERRAEERWRENGYTEPDTNASYYPGKSDWNEAQDEEDENCAHIIRSSCRHSTAPSPVGLVGEPARFDDSGYPIIKSILIRGEATARFVLASDYDALRTAAEQRVGELEQSLDLIHDADMRGIALWRADSPTERELILPDRAEHIFWLMQKIDTMCERAEQLQRENERICAAHVGTMAEADRRLDAVQRDLDAARACIRDAKRVKISDFRWDEWEDRNAIAIALAKDE